MPYLRILDLRADAPLEFETDEVRVGRDPGLECTISGDEAGVVSATHCKFVYRERHWWIEDIDSRNGTFLEGRRLTSGEALELTPGLVIGLGKTGPRFKVEAAASRPVDRTVQETSGPPGVPAPKTPGTIYVLFVDSISGQGLEASAPSIRIGRAPECEVRPGSGDLEAVSRIHAELTLDRHGTVLLRDAGSVNGTTLNGEPVEGARRVRAGDRIGLGGGPTLIVEELAATFERPTPLPVADFEAGEADGGIGIPTPVIRRLVAEANRTSGKRGRALIWSIVVILVGVVGALYYQTEVRERATAAQLEQQRLALEEQRAAIAAQRAATDSVLRNAGSEYAIIRAELDSAMATSAPAAVVDSLRLALDAANERTLALEAALERAQASIVRQLAAGDSARRAAAAEVDRLRGQVAQAAQNQVSPQLLDSLRRAVRAAEEQVTGIGAQIRAVRGVNLAAVAQENQAAVGLVTVYKGGQLFDGSGFIITPSGYFVTNRHVVVPEGAADSIFVTMADQRFMVPADLVTVAADSGPDLAVLNVRQYSGPHMRKVDWSGAKASQGEPAALIGFPAGIRAALDDTRTVRTSMSAGIFSKVTPERIQFDGFSVPGSSGSPIFNAEGEVVGVHRGSLRGATGLGFAVPIKQLIPILPPEALTELGLQ